MAKINKIYKHNIVHIHSAVDNVKQLLSIVAVLVLFVLCMLYGKVYNLSIYSSIMQIMSPVENLYSDTGSAVFSSNIKLKDLKLILPIKCQDFEIVDGAILLEVGESIMVVAPENGTISEINNLNSGGKYISISLANNYMCVLENVDVVGVKVGDTVKKGKEIATSNPNSVITMKVYGGGKLLTNFVVVKNQLQWIE